MQRFASILLTVLIACLFSGVIHAVMVIPLNLEQMTRIADRIFRGTVLSVEDAHDEEGRWCQYITFSVEEGFKGELDSVLKIKQINPKPIERPDGTIVQSTLFRGIPQYQVGETVLVFLNGDSAIGFTSPVGLMQGAFKVNEDASGHQKVVNGLGNIGLFKKMSHLPALRAQGITAARFEALSAKPDDLYLDQLRGFLRALTTQAPAKSQE